MASAVIVAQMQSYHPSLAEILAEFLNSMIDTELPIDGLLALTEFLELTDVSTKVMLEEQRVERPGNYRSQFQREIDSIQNRLTETNKLALVCQTCIIKAEGTSVMAGRVIKTRPDQSAVPLPQFPNVPGPILSARLHNAVHNALLKVMGERDQSRASFAAADVLHVHELKQERKKTKKLEEELESKRFFGTEQQAQARLRKQRQDSINDDELMSLCQQLSSEIAARTSACLETERLKEMRETERTNEALEKESLQEEIERLKEQLQSERNATATSRRESETWQRSFEELMDIRALNDGEEPVSGNRTSLK